MINLKKSFISLNDLHSVIFYLTSNKPKQVQEATPTPELEDINLDEVELEEQEVSEEQELQELNIKEIEIYNLSSFIMSLHNLGRMFKNRFDVEIEYKKFNKKEYEFYLNIDKIKKTGWKPQSTFRTIVEDITCDFDSLKNLSYNLNRVEQVKSCLSIFNINNCLNNNTDNNIENTIWKKKEECRVCQSKSLFNVLNLGNQPPPNRLSDKYYKLLSFPLVLVGCSECYHLQLNGVVNPSIMYKDYTYTSGTSQSMNLYFKNFVEKVNNNILIKINKNKKVKKTT